MFSCVIPTSKSQDDTIFIGLCTNDIFWIYSLASFKLGVFDAGEYSDMLNGISCLHPEIMLQVWGGQLCYMIFMDV